MSDLVEVNHFSLKYVTIRKAKKIGTVNHCYSKKINISGFQVGRDVLVSEWIFSLGLENRNGELWIGLSV